MAFNAASKCQNNVHTECDKYIFYKYSITFCAHNNFLDFLKGNIGGIHQEPLQMYINSTQRMQWHIVKDKLH